MGFFEEMRRAFDAEKDSFKQTSNREKISHSEACIQFFRKNNPGIHVDIKDIAYPFYFMLIARVGGKRSVVIVEDKDKGFRFQQAAEENPEIEYVSWPEKVSPYLADPEIMKKFEAEIKAN